MASAHPQHRPGGERALKLAMPSTVLKWCGNGELSSLDLETVVERLKQADPVARSLQLSHFQALQTVPRSAAGPLV